MKETYPGSHKIEAAPEDAALPCRLLPRRGGTSRPVWRMGFDHPAVKVQSLAIYYHTANMDCVVALKGAGDAELWSPPRSPFARMRFRLVLAHHL
jgi:hypothetical protein